MIRIAKLPEGWWKVFRDLRLEALKNDPSAFGSSYEEERGFSEDIWRGRLKNVLFAFSEEKPIGMLSYVFSNRIKTKHIVSFHGVYVAPRHRGLGIGGKLVKRALSEARKNRHIIKVQLSVNADLRPAVWLYKRAGFEEVGRVRKELKVAGRYYDLLLMEKEIRKVSG